MIGQFLRSVRQHRQMDPLHVTMTGVRMVCLPLTLGVPTESLDHPR